MKNVGKFFFLFCCVAVAAQAQWASPTPVRSQFGQMTTAKINSIPDFVLPAIYKDRVAHPLPAVVNHETDGVSKPYMPPVNWCIDGWCCSNASGTSFSYDYAVQVEKKITSASVGSKPLMTYNYTYHFMNNADQSTGGDGFMYVESFDILKATGGATSTDFGGFDGAVDQTNAWMSGYDKYYNAMKVRADEYYKIDMGAAGADNMIKQIVYDAANGTPQGAILSLMANSEDMKRSPVNGRTTFSTLGGGGGHALAICGYDDTFQGGCWLIQAMWGTGDMWLPYTMLHSGTPWYGNPSSNKYVMFCRIKKNYTPRFAFKINMTHNQRNKICLMTGAAGTTNATVPSKSMNYGEAFNYGGGSVPMCGSGQSSTIEIGLDLSDLTPAITKVTADSGYGAFFLRVLSNGGTGQVNSLSLMDYNGATVKEIKCAQTNVAINGTIAMSVPWAGKLSQTTSVVPSTLSLRQSNGLAVTYASNLRNVQLTFPAAALRSAVLRIVNASGRTVMAKACSNKVSGRATVSWDMNNDNGERVAPGAYIASIDITGLDGAVSHLTNTVVVRN
jgi:hypothetical protein